MSRLAEVCVRRPVFASMLVLLLVVLGALSYTRLGIDLYPRLDFPFTSVVTTMKGASVEEMETQITKPLEESINQIEGIDRMTSVTKEGVSRIMVGFVLERDAQQSAQDVRDKVSAALGELPPEADSPVIVRFDLDDVPVLRIAVSGERDLREITEMADNVLKEGIETVPGVGGVQILGGRERAIQISVDTDKLDAYHLSIAQVRQALRAQNVELPGGRVDEGARELTLRTLGRMERVEDFETLVVGALGSRPVTLRDIATVTDGWVEPRSHASLDGRTSVTLQVRKQSGANTAAVAMGVKKRIEELRKVVPRDIHLEVIKDQSRFIQKSIGEAQFHLLLGGILVALSTILFMGDIRSTLIAAIAIPTSIIATFTAMWVLDFTLNNVTLLALILSVGIVIDDAVVVLENIYRHIEELGKSPFQAAIDGTREIGLAVMATTFSLMVIFVPLAFMSGMTGRFLHEFGITTAVAIFVSMIISFTLTPMLCSRFLRAKENNESSRKGHRLYRLIDEGYASLLRWSLGHRWTISLLSLATVLSTVPIFMLVGKDFLPQDDQSEFEISMQTPEGYPLERTAGVFEEIARRIEGLRGVEHTVTSVGDSLAVARTGSGEGDVTTGSIYVKLSELTERDFTQADVMGDAREIMADYPELRSSVQAANPFMGGARHADFSFDLTGPDLERLAEISSGVAEKMRQIPGFVDVDTTLALRKPEVHVAIDRQNAADLGVRVEDIAATLRTLVGGEPVTTFKEGSERYDVWLRASVGDRRDSQSIYSMTVPRPNGELVTLSNLVTMDEGRGPAQIDRLGRERQVTVMANLDGLPLGDAMKHASRLVAEIDLPELYAVRFSNDAESMGETAGNFGIAFGLSALFMYMVLAAQFESFVYPISILLSLPLSVPFALLSLLIMNQHLNLYSILGLFMLFGIVKKNGILQVDYTNHLRAEGMEREKAILQANHVRLRPILMTTVMLVMGMIPIALGRGPGAGSRASMANVIIGGQTLCLVLTLLVTPVAYSLLDDLGMGRRRWHPFARLRELFGRPRPSLDPLPSKREDPSEA